MPSVSGTWSDTTSERAKQAVAQEDKDFEDAQNYLDKATKAKIDRGMRQQEIMKQRQYQPMPVEHQIMIIYAGTKGFLDDLPVEQCRKFEEELYRFMENAHRPVLEEIAAKKALDEGLTAKVKGCVEEFKKRFVEENKSVPAHA